MMRTAALLAVILLVGCVATRPPCNPGGACPCDRDACDCIRDDEASCLVRPDLPSAPKRFAWKTR
jgi:hypothetical protein